ncbi:hypothetical protein BDD12DRAFT_811413 [Trichophaea hybrida]|nr:hypothetical protein BDD12DRAFT_811413 [Trichophaea hybrida]
MDPWKDAEQYPQDRLSQHAIHGDPSFYRSRLAKDCHYLCLQANRDRDVAALRNYPVTITDVPKHGIGNNAQAQLQTETVSANAENNELIKCLRNFRDPARHSRVFSIQPSNPKRWSWCQMGITVDMLRQILTTYQVMPGFLDYVHMFGQKTNDIDNSFGGGIHELSFAENSGLLDQYEISYSLNYAVEKNGSDDFWKKWVLRRTAVYQKFSYDDQSSTWILLYPSDRARERVQESLQVQSKKKCISHAQKTLETHMTLFSSAAENWRSYYNLLETFFNDETSHALYCDVSTPDQPESSRREALDVKFSDLQHLQKFEEKVHEFQRSLEANKEAIRTLATLNSDIRKFSLESEKDDQCWYRVDHALEKHRLELGLQQKSIESFLKRISGRSQLLYNILDVKNSTTVSFYEQTKTELDKNARRETERMHNLNVEMRDMAEQTSKDAVSMKIITLVAMIYLPITFIATFLNSGITTFQHDDFIEVKSEALALKARMGFSREAFAMFMILSVPLLAVTLLGWFLFDRRSRRLLKEKREGKFPKSISMA